MVMCLCGFPAVIRTSWTDRNPGRRFYACSNAGSNCRFIGWIDPPMCNRAMEIIPGLLRSKNIVEELLKEKEDEAKRLKTLLVCSWIAMFAVLAKMF